MSADSHSSILSQLAALHQSKDPKKEFPSIGPFLVTDPQTHQPFWPSYIPFVGTQYLQHRILCIATSQNLARWRGKAHWATASGQNRDPLFRLYPMGKQVLNDPSLVPDIPWNKIPIAPMEEGIFPALAGLWMATKDHETIADFQKVSQKIAVTNFFKHSLMKDGKNVQPFGDPAKELLGEEAAQAFRKKTLVHYVLPEIEILAPQIIITYKTFIPYLKEGLSSQPSPPKILGINDPSWIKQGMNGKAKIPDGEWFKKTQTHPLDPDLDRLLGNYLEQMGDLYRKKKEHATRVYLSFYAQEMQGSQAEKDPEKPHPEAPPPPSQIKIPLFPRYDELRSLLPIWEGWPKNAITHLRTTIGKIRGTPQNPVDWLDPETWIPERLEGKDRDLAEAIWKQSKGQVNPRYVQGHWLLASNYHLLQEGPTGTLGMNERGHDFVDSPLGKVEMEIDRSEGLLKILGIVADHGEAPFRELVPDWKEHLARHSNYRTQNTIHDSLRRRLNNLIHRGLLERKGSKYSITQEGMTYLETSEEASPITETPHQQIRTLARQQDRSVRESIQTILQDLDPYLFEFLIKRLLEEMGYSNVEVTSPSGDGGVDVIAQIQLGITSVREVVQVKRHKRSIQRKDLDALRGCLHRFGAVRGTIITTARFSKGTQNAAFEPGAAPITLIDGTKLIDLLIENNIGVQKKSIELLQLDREAFSKNELGDLEE